MCEKFAADITHTEGLTWLPRMRLKRRITQAILTEAFIIFPANNTNHTR
jgi:hypothetical protein